MQQVPRLKDVMPNWAGAAGGAVIIATLIFTTIATYTRDRTPPAPGAGSPIVSSRAVAFDQRAEAGVIVVRDAGTGGEITTLVDADNSFMQNVYKVLTKERRRRAVALDLPYQVSAHENGRVAIMDLTTGRVIDINAFGANQVKAFASLL
ncbi:MAG: photosynthetic complex assembly protein PuhC [Pseudomonadota bacterium]